MGRINSTPESAMRRYPLVLFLTFSALLMLAGSASPSATVFTDRILVHFSPHTAKKVQDAVLKGVGGRRLGTIDQLGIVVIAVPAGRAVETTGKLAASPVVSYVEVDGLVHAATVEIDDTLLNSSYWQLANPRLPDAWSLTTGSKDIVVAVLDTGVDIRHEDLGSFVPGYDFVHGDHDPTDDNGHGTAVAGIIAAQGNNGLGTAGVCWLCQIMSVKVLGADNNGDWSDVASGIVWAVRHGARVINMSFGLPSGSRAVADALTYATSHGVVLVAAAGNENSSHRDYPAAYPNVIAVGAVDEQSVRYAPGSGISWGSNYGPWVSVDAPGCVNTTWPATRGHSVGGYTYFCGTSAATPFVSGLAALALSYVPTASAVEVVHAIEATAHQTTDRNSAHGLIDALAALTALRELPPGSTISFTPVVLRQTALTVRLANTSTTTGPYYWSFGDGKTSVKKTPTHSYRTSGTYKVTLSAAGKSAEARVSVVARGRVTGRLTQAIFSREAAGAVKFVYHFSAPSRTFTYRVIRLTSTSWRTVRVVRNIGSFRGSHYLTVRQLFKSTLLAPGHYRLLFTADKNHPHLAFVVN